MLEKNNRDNVIANTFTNRYEFIINNLGSMVIEMQGSY